MLSAEEAAACTSSAYDSPIVHRPTDTSGVAHTEMVFYIGLLSSIQLFVIIGIFAVEVWKTGR